MANPCPRPQHLPPLPELPPNYVWHSRASASEAYSVLSRSYDRSSQLLRLEDGDPIRLRLHSEQITRRCIPIFEALCRELPPDALPWIQICRGAFDSLVRELDKTARVFDEGHQERLAKTQYITTVQTGQRGRPALEIDPGLLEDAMSANRKISLSELARSLGIHRHTLRKQLRDHGITTQEYSTISDDDLDLVIMIYKELHPKSGIRYVQGFLSQLGLRIQRARDMRLLSEVKQGFLPPGTDLNDVDPTLLSRYYGVEGQPQHRTPGHSGAGHYDLDSDGEGSEEDGLERDHNSSSASGESDSEGSGSMDIDDYLAEDQQRHIRHPPIPVPGDPSPFSDLQTEELFLRCLDEGPRKGSSSTSKAPTEKLSEVGSVALLPHGLGIKGDAADGKPNFVLVNDRWPTGDEEQELQFHGLLVAVKPGTAKERIYFNPSWGPERIDMFLRELFPSTFAYLDARHGIHCGPHRDQLHYGLIKRSNRTAILIRKQSPLEGEDLAQARANSGRNNAMSRLCFVSRYKIPQEVYQDFEAAMERVKNGTIAEIDPLPSQPATPFDVDNCVSDSGDDLLDDDEWWKTKNRKGMGSNVARKEKGKKKGKGKVGKGKLRATSDKGKGKGKARALPASSDGEDAESSELTDESECLTTATTTTHALVRSSPGPSTSTQPVSSRLRSGRVIEHLQARPRPQKRARSPSTDVNSGNGDIADSDGPGPSKRLRSELSSPMTPIVISDDEGDPPVNLRNPTPQPTIGATPHLSPSPPPFEQDAEVDINAWLAIRRAKGLPTPKKPKVDPWARAG
ncbi:transcription factor [Ganoderma sinense ZZ0214-1]|uniref:Transcription factor n=1 Tax=Ganoderma sinense ZZ0214-1 TaxID=1077348 RepID=A0A2G8SF69_9APHY|nr:transcription factor [Ganoderma sinense ZZ0214-1]